MDHSECFEVQNSKNFRGCAPKPPGEGGGAYNAPRPPSCYNTRFTSVARYARMLGKLSGPQTNFRFHPCTLSRWKVFAGRRSCACRLQTFLSTTAYGSSAINEVLFPLCMLMCMMFVLSPIAFSPCILKVRYPYLSFLTHT